MQKAFSRITWYNLPSTDTALEAQNLNRIESGLDTVDSRVVAFDTSKANQADFLTAVKSVTFDKNTGTFTITYENNTTSTIDTDIEKVAVNFDYDPVTERLILYLSDGSTKYVDLSALITEYEFQDTATIHFAVTGGKVTAAVIDGSITEDKLQPNFLADIRVESAKAENAASAALNSAHDAEAWGVGQINGVDVPPTDPRYNNNSKYYAGQSADSASAAEQSKEDAAGILEQVEIAANNTVFSVNFETGNLEYTNDTLYDFSINYTTGNLEWEVVTV